MIALAFLLLPVVLGDLAPLFTQEKPVHRNGLRSYIVIFNDGAPDFEGKEHIQKWLSSEVPSVNPSEVENVYDIYDTYRGFAAFLSDSGLTALREHDFVKYIEEDGVVELDAFTDRQDWGQIRVNQRARNLSTNSATYTYATGYPNGSLDTTVWNFLSGIQALVNGDGSTATVCVVDTGVRNTHQEVAGRIDGNISYVAGQTTDGNGHGTHVAGSCCGRYRGMARNTRITWAKVLSDSGSGTTANVISGVNWCAGRANNPSRTWIISMSLGGGSSTALNDAVNSAAQASVPVVAAGNDNSNTCSGSPAQATRAITVAATDKDDNKASFSNTGTCVNIWAPGVSIHSSWYTSDTAYNTISGTSMATPLVSGLVAALSNAGALTRDSAMSALQSRGNSGVVKNCPANTPNLLASTGRTP